MFKLSFCLLCAYLTLYAWSQNMSFANGMINKSALPSSIKSTLNTQGFVLVGATTFSVFFWDIYKSKLLTTSGKYPVAMGKGNLLFDIHYLTDISSEELIKRTVEQWEHLEIPPERYLDFLPTLKKVWPDIKAGDSLSLLIHQGSSYFYFNHAYVDVISDQNFGQMFIDIWLSEKTSEPDLRRELLGGITDE